MRSPVSPLNKALYNRLKAAAMPTAVYDYVPSGKAAPYVVLTDTVAAPDDTKTSLGYEVLASLMVYSEYQGDKEVAELADKLITAVGSQELTLDNDWAVAMVRLNKHAVERLETYRQALIEFKFLIIDMKG